MESSASSGALSVQESVRIFELEKSLAEAQKEIRAMKKEQTEEVGERLVLRAICTSGTPCY